MIRLFSQKADEYRFAPDGATMLVAGDITKNTSYRVTYLSAESIPGGSVKYSLLKNAGATALVSFTVREGGAKSAAKTPSGKYIFTVETPGRAAKIILPAADVSALAPSMKYYTKPVDYEFTTLSVKRVIDIEWRPGRQRCDIAWTLRGSGAVIEYLFSETHLFTKAEWLLRESREQVVAGESGSMATLLSKEDTDDIWGPMLGLMDGLFGQ